MGRETQHKADEVARGGKRSRSVEIDVVVGGVALIPGPVNTLGEGP